MNTPSYFLSSEAPSLVHTPGTVSDQDTEYEYSLANSTLMLGDVPRGTSAKQLAKALCEHSNNVLRSEQVLLQRSQPKGTTWTIGFASLDDPNAVWMWAQQQLDVQKGKGRMALNLPSDPKVVEKRKYDVKVSWTKASAMALRGQTKPHRQVFSPSPTAFLDPAMVPLPQSPGSTRISPSYSSSPPYKHHDPACVRTRRSPTPDNALEDEPLEAQSYPTSQANGSNATSSIIIAMPSLADPFIEDNFEYTQETDAATRWYEDYSIEDLENDDGAEDEYARMELRDIITSMSNMSLGGRARRP